MIFCTKMTLSSVDLDNPQMSVCSKAKACKTSDDWAEKS